MVAAACLTLGMIELRIGLAQRHQRAARLLFALSACAMAAAAGWELALTQVDTIVHAESLLRALGITVGVMLVSLMAFVWVYFGYGNRWLGLAVPSLYVIGILGDLVTGPVMTYHHTVTGLRTVETFGGATFVTLERSLHLWNVFTYLATLMLIVFVADASLRLWRRGGHRRALVIGGSVAFFLLVGGFHTALVSTGKVNLPYMISWCYLAILVAMASELNADVLAAARLAGQLRESERSMDLAGAAAALGMWAWNISDGSIWATARARALFGFSAAETLSMDNFVNALHPDDREIRRLAIEHALATGDDYEVEFRVPLTEGRSRWISSRGRVERGANGEPLGIRGVVLDVSARRDAEVELQMLHSQLAHASRVSMLGQLASALAHELSQPLGAILRNTEAAELFLQHDSPDLGELREILGDIRQDNQRAADVIQRMRALLKHQEFNSRALSLRGVLDNVSRLIRNEAFTRRTQVEFDGSIEPSVVMGDSVQLQQVLLNLVINAMDAVNDLPVEGRKVTVRTQQRGEGEIEVAVTDSGPGIAPQSLARLFEPFFTTKPGGLGIGLTISRTIIEAHGGRIWAESGAGEGATFRFALPLAEEAIAS